MSRLCERPGCAEPAAVSYGFDPERRVVWFETFSPDGGPTSGRICQRHADAMVLPNGWWLEDRRTPDALFTATSSAPAVAEAPAAKAAPKRTRRKAGAASLPLPDLATGDDDAVPGVTAPDLSLVPGGEPGWTPVFDEDDDLGGQLNASTPLLSRAFGRDPGVVRKRPKPPTVG
ncbi:MAG TPA: DUF3499 family protein [Acidimicrobiales bacterium]